MITQNHIKNGLVALWDAGPKEPEAPKRPEAADVDAGSPEHDLAMIELQKDLPAYEATLRGYIKAKEEFENFGEPKLVSMTTVDAAHALQADSDRYSLVEPKKPEADVRTAALDAREAELEEREKALVEAEESLAKAKKDFEDAQKKAAQ